MLNRADKYREREYELAHVDGIHKKIEKPSYGLENLAEFRSGKSPDIPTFLWSLKDRSNEVFEYRGGGEIVVEKNCFSFESDITSNVPENNQVKGTFYKGREQKAIIILPNWNATGKDFNKLAKLFSMFGYSSLRLSLPYHDERKPASWSYSKNMVSPNIGLTISAFRQAVLDVRCAIDWLEVQGITKTFLVGISIGSCIATVTAAHDRRVRGVAQMLMASNFAEVVWTGLATKHIRDSFAGFIDLPNLKKSWAIVSPDSYIPNLADNDTKLLMITGKYDPVSVSYTHLTLPTKA